MCSKGTWICEVRPGMPFSGFFLTRKQNGECLIIADSSGCMSLRIGANATVNAGGLAWVSVRLDDGLGQEAISILPVARWDGNPFAFVEPDLPGHGVARTLYAQVEGIQDDELRRLVEILFSDRSLLRAFMSAPASLRHHHAWPGGLATHTAEVVDMASKVTNGLYQADRDMVATACLLHDVGKAYEYAGSGQVLSRRGELVGHEVTLLEMFAPVADRIWSAGHPKRLMLLHLLTAKPAPKWTGIRHPRTPLVSALRFADRWSSERDQYAYNYTHSPEYAGSVQHLNTTETEPESSRGCRRSNP